jgi:hypothetical protein
MSINPNFHYFQSQYISPTIKKENHLPGSGGLINTIIRNIIHKI